MLLFLIAARSIQAEKGGLRLLNQSVKICYILIDKNEIDRIKLLINEIGNK